MKVNKVKFELKVQVLACSSHASSLDQRIIDDFKQAYEYLDNVSPGHIWSFTNHYPDLASRLHVQVRIMVNFGLNGSLPWLADIEGMSTRCGNC